MQLFMANAKAGLAGDPLLAVADVIQWDEVEKHMQADYWQAMFRKGGRAPYDYRAMFRALLLARWFGLSYPKLERALRVRLDFLLFCGFVIGDKMPDASTLNRFNTRLVKVAHWLLCLRKSSGSCVSRAFKCDRHGVRWWRPGSSGQRPRIFARIAPCCG